MNACHLTQWNICLDDFNYKPGVESRDLCGAKYEGRVINVEIYVGLKITPKYSM